MTIKDLQHLIDQRAENQLDRELRSATDPLVKFAQAYGVARIDLRDDRNEPVLCGSHSLDTWEVCSLIKGMLWALLRDKFVEREAAKFLKEFEEIKRRMEDLEGIEKGG